MLKSVVTYTCVMPMANSYIFAAEVNNVNVGGGIITPAAADAGGVTASGMSYKSYVSGTQRVFVIQYDATFSTPTDTLIPQWQSGAWTSLPTITNPKSIYGVNFSVPVQLTATELSSLIAAIPPIIDALVA